MAAGKVRGQLQRAVPLYELLTEPIFPPIQYAPKRNLANEQEIAFDEHTGHHAIYICGVVRKGYSVKKN